MGDASSYVDPLIMTFTECFVGGSTLHPSSLARGLGMPTMRVTGCAGGVPRRLTGGRALLPACDVS